MKSGDVLYFWGEEQVLMVTMANEKGVRAYDIERPEFTDDGFVKTNYLSYEELNEMCSYMGNIKEMVRSKIDQ